MLKRLLGILPVFSLIGAAFGQGTIQTTAGTGTCGYGGDGSQATQATLCNPQATATDGAGNVYFVDQANYRIRKIDTNGVITTVAGNGVQGSSGDGGPALNASIGTVGELLAS